MKFAGGSIEVTIPRFDVWVVISTLLHVVRRPGLGGVGTVPGLMFGTSQFDRIAGRHREVTLKQSRDDSTTAKPCPN